MEGLELVAFEIISAVGTARSLYIEAIAAAKAGEYERAESLLEEGEQSFVAGHDAHLKLLKGEANGDKVTSLLIIHAEDQLMSAEGFKIIATEFIEAYKRLEALEKK